MNFTLSFCPLILSVLTEEIGFTALVMLNAITKPKGQKSGSKIRMYGQDREVAGRSHTSSVIGTTHIICVWCLDAVEKTGRSLHDE